jgi:hypothetical protein
LLLEQAVEPLEALRLGDGLRVTPGGVLRPLAQLIERVLARSGFTIDLGLRRERFLKLSAGRCGESRRKRGLRSMMRRAICQQAAVASCSV